jgi:hypothetical protein
MEALGTGRFRGELFRQRAPHSSRTMAMLAKNCGFLCVRAEIELTGTDNTLSVCALQIVF